ncbi:MAG: class 1 fructose-bisphosphatase [Planctomycetota bacterium]|nr:MAG: class 1 fructose-bisphosphatase [Planctomycetota bacterium]
MSRPTLIEHILRTQQHHPNATGKLSRILARLSLAGRMMANRILNAGFLGEHGAAGMVNVQGEDQQKLDVLANDIFTRVFDTLSSVVAVGSEEMDEIFEFPHHRDSGEYVVLFDPLDGSGNIDVNGGIGSIFSVLHRKSAKGEPANLEDFLQPGRDLVAGGYILYGPVTQFVYTAGMQGTVNCFTLDRMVGEFFLTHEDLMIPSGTGTYAVNESNQSKWDEKTRALVASYRCGEDPVGKRGARYSGALVSDFHRILLKGGIFMYPGLLDRPRGKLRYLYEVGPLALVAERAGGMSTDGKTRSLDLKPTELHERCPLFIGSKEDVEYAMSQLA